jgi:hypothetical protein
MESASLNKNVNDALVQPPQILITKQGYTIVSNGTSYGPCSNLDEIDLAEASRFLKVERPALDELKDYAQKHIRKTWEQKDDGLVIRSDDSVETFTAKASIGPDVSPCGFIHFVNDDWIAAETTFWSGESKGVDEEGKPTTSTSLKPVVLFNHAGERGIKLLKDAVFEVGSQRLAPRAGTFGSEGFSTLMDLETGRRFLNGATVDPWAWYHQIKAKLKLFVDLSFDSRLCDVVICIIMSVFFYDLFGVSPLIIIFGPWESGKGRLLLCITLMGHRGMPEVDITDAAFFRSVEAWKPLLGVDEFGEISRDLEKILRTLYKPGIKVPRMEKSKGGKFFLALFDTFTKVVIATDVLSPPNLLQKGILIVMRKMNDPGSRDPNADDFKEVRASGYIARLTWPPTIKQTAEQLGKKSEIKLKSRDLEVWKPALTMASILGGSVWKNVLDYARKSRAEIAVEVYEELKQVLEAIFEIIKEKVTIDDKTAHFPSQFTPKQIHDIIWEQVKNDYRIVKVRQEVIGEQGEEYDYNTRDFESSFSVQKIGRTYLKQLDLKRKRVGQGTRYTIESAAEFNALVERYHPDLMEQLDYFTLIGNNLPNMQDMQKQSKLNMENASNKDGKSEAVAS